MIEIPVRAPILEAAAKMAKEAKTPVVSWLSDMMETYVVERYQRLYGRKVGEDFKNSNDQSAAKVLSREGVRCFRT